jgi:hypothetical protein
VWCKWSEDFLDGRTIVRGPYNAFDKAHLIAIFTIAMICSKSVNLAI